MRNGDGRAMSVRNCDEYRGGWPLEVSGRAGGVDLGRRFTSHLFRHTSPTSRAMNEVPQMRRAPKFSPSSGDALGDCAKAVVVKPSVTANRMVFDACAFMGVVLFRVMTEMGGWIAVV